MAFTAADVKNLREMTGVGILDCKKALAETDGDMDKAVEFLREKGLAAAQKKAGRIAAEGMAYAEVFSDGAALVEVNAETDFVAKNAKFVEFVKDICYVVARWGPDNMPDRRSAEHGSHPRSGGERDRDRAGQRHCHADRCHEPHVPG